MLQVSANNQKNLDNLSSFALLLSKIVKNGRASCLKAHALLRKLILSKSQHLRTLISRKSQQIIKKAIFKLIWFTAQQNCDGRALCL